MTTAEDLICPECGGAVGGSKTPGVVPCRCFATPKTPRPAAKVDDSALAPSNPAPPIQLDASGKPAKTCVVCHKNLTNQKRFKDERGYICFACDLEKRAEDADKVRCRECKRKVKESALVEWRGRKICKLCAKDHRDGDKPRMKPIRVKGERAHEKKRLLWIGAIVAALALVIVFGLLRRMT